MGLKIKLKFKKLLAVLLAVCLLSPGLAQPAAAAEPQAVSVAGGWQHSLALKDDGTVWAWGDNEYGQLGDGTVTGSDVPVQVTSLSHITAIAAGRWHSLALKDDGTVWAWGHNEYGQLGDGTVTGSDVPVQVTSLSHITAIAAGGLHSMALKDDGTVWAWGLNANGQLGDGTYGVGSDKTAPVQVTGLSGITAITAGYQHSLALKSDGTAWAWGFNGSGQLGNGASVGANPFPAQVAQTTGLSVITDLAAGSSHSLALKNDGTAWSWGGNSLGQLGNGSAPTGSYVPVQIPDLSGITALAAGWTHSLALKNDDTVWAWGSNYYGQLGDGTYGEDNSIKAAPVQVRDTPETGYLSGAAGLAAGYQHSLALKDDGTVWAWGYNDYGQLGDGTADERHTPVQVQFPEADVCEIVGVDQYPSLDDALDEAGDGDTIKLLSDIDFNGGILVNGKTITFDVNGYTLNVVNTAGIGLRVENDGSVDLEDTSPGGDGEFNVTGTTTGVYVVRGEATVSGATATTGTGAFAVGTYAIIVITGDVQGITDGVCAGGSGSSVTVSGNVQSDQTGAHVYDGGTVTVNGQMTAGASYVIAGSAAVPVYLSESDYQLDPANPGYYLYTNSGAEKAWVRIPSPGPDLAWSAASGTDNAISGNIRQVTAGSGGRLVAINGSGRLIVSADKGENWSPVDTGSFVPNAVVFDGRGFIAAGNGLMMSSDGTSWIAAGVTGLNDWTGYTVHGLTTAYTSKGIVTLACGTNGLILVTTSDSGDPYTDWMKLETNTTAGFFHKFSYVPEHTYYDSASGSYNTIQEKFTGYGGNSIYSVTAFTDESTFRDVSPYSDTAVQWFTNVWYEPTGYTGSPEVTGKFYAARPDGVETELLCSDNGRTEWTVIGAHNINGYAANGDGIMVKAGDGGKILTSSDGTAWTEQTASAYDINDVIFAGGMFVAVGDHGTILASAGGSSWHTCTSGTANDLTSAAYVSGTFVAAGNGVILWSVAGTDYTVTYNGNGSTGGTVPSDGNIYTQGAAVTVLGNTGGLVKTGYTFADWNTLSDGNGTSYAAGSTLTVDEADVTLYAQWAAALNTVTFDSKGGSPVASISAISGSTISQPPDPTRENYAFKGWYKNTYCWPGYEWNFSTGTVVGDITLYAKWVLTYTVTYHGNGNTGGSAPVDANRYEPNDSVTVLGPGSLVKEGFTFTGWNTAANGSGNSYGTGGGEFEMYASDRALYAQWSSSATCTLTYNGNGNTGGTVPFDSGSYAQGAAVTVLGNTGSLAKTDYTFAGWNTAANGSGTDYPAGATLIMGTGNITLYAKWEPTSGTAPIITTDTLPGGTVSTGYSETLAATGSTPITWSISNGDLPDGLTLAPDTGEISGTPTTEGSFSFTVKALNGNGEDTQDLSIVILAAASTDAAPPVWTSGYPRTFNVQDEDLILVISADENCTAYYVVLAAGAAGPGAEQVRDCQDAEGATAPGGNFSYTTPPNERNHAVLGLTPATAYGIYVVLEDTEGNLQVEPASIDVTTLPDIDTVPYDANSGITNQTQGANGSRQVTLTITVQNEAGDPLAGIGPGYFEVSIDGGPAQQFINDPPFTGFTDNDDGTYTVVFTGGDDNKEYSFTNLSVGYYDGSDLESVIIESGPTAVTTPGSSAGNVCEIVGGDQYASLDDALDDALGGATSGHTIRLLEDIDFQGGILVNSKSITFDVNGYTLDIVNNEAGGRGLIVENNGSVDLTDTSTGGGGELNITGKVYGVTADNASVTVTNITATDLGSIGAFANNNSSINTGSVQAGQFAAYAFGGSYILVAGDATATASNGKGAYANGNGEIEILGNITATGGAESIGAHADGGSDITVGGTINATTYIKIGDVPVPQEGYTGIDGSYYVYTSAANPGNTVLVRIPPAPPDSGDNNGGRRSGRSTPPAPAYNAVLSGAGAAGTSLPVQVNANAGSATVNLNSLGGDLFGDEERIISMPSIPGVDDYTLALPASALSGPADTGALAFSTEAGGITIPGNMLSGTGPTGDAEITIGRGDTSSLPADVKTAIGDRPVIQLTLSINGRQTDWNNPDAPVTVSIPYTPTAAELANPESIVVWYIDGSGNAVCIPNGRYDPESGTVIFDVTHFSDYAVAYNQADFIDVPAGAWYHKAVSFIAARDITTGTGGGNFSPGLKLTRGQFIVMLMKAYEITPDTAGSGGPDSAAEAAGNFSDAGSTYYTGYLAAAKRLGISAGVGNNMFTPEKQITRQEMFTLLYNALNVISQTPQTPWTLEAEPGRTLSSFSDADQVASWAKDAVTRLVEAGAIGGNKGKLNPTGTTTRAEMAQVLYNLLSK